MNIGLIQTGAIGDIIIAAPIAQYFKREGYNVFWPVDSQYIDYLRFAFEGIGFDPIDRLSHGFRSRAYFLDEPLVRLQKVACEKIFPLYSSLGDINNIVNPIYAGSLKFDEYKYAVCGLPFNEKWNLKLNRDANRERELFQKLEINKNYVVLNNVTGSGEKIDWPLNIETIGDRQIVEVTSITDNPFDWLFTFENADALFFIDSMFANLVDQLQIGPPNKFLKFRSSVSYTPVFRSGWTFIA